MFSVIIIHLLQLVVILLLVATTCVSGNCGVPQPRLDASPTGLNAAVEMYPAHSEVVYSCDRGYVKLRSEASGISKCIPSMRNENEHEWSIPDIECAPIQCPSPPRPNNGDVVETDFTVGMTVTFKCSYGYEMHDNNERILESPVLICNMDTSWVGNVPTCELVQCPDPQSVDHASKRVTRNTFGGKVIYQCLEGFKFIAGNLERTCLASGIWSGEKPVCEDTLCVDPDTEKFKQDYNLKKVDVHIALNPGDTATFFCSNDKRVHSTCTEGGEWTNLDDCMIQETPGSTATTPTRTIAEHSSTASVGSVSSTQSVVEHSGEGIGVGRETQATEITVENFTSPGTPVETSLPLGLIIGVAIGVTALVIAGLIIGLVLHRRKKLQSEYRKPYEMNGLKSEAEMKSLTPVPEKV